jgi:transposase
MSLRSPLGYCLPEETARVARAAFPRGNPYLRLYDALGPIFHNPDFADLYSAVGQPAEDPAPLALVTLFQFAEGLTDRQAADAVRARIDWKFCLCLPLEDQGFDASVLVEFRARLLAGGAEQRLFEAVLTCLKEQGFVKARGKQRTDSTHVLAAIQVLNRLECVGETLRHALNVLATVAPTWLQGWAPVAWFDRYGQRLQEYRLPKGREERERLAAQIGADGRRLLAQLDGPTAPAGLGHLPAVRVLRRVWLEQYYADEPIRWRRAEDLPPAAIMISSPYDVEARFCVKRETAWTGHKVHLTETCDDDTPNVITDVATTPATTTDYEATAGVHDRLAARGLLPREHFVDTTYVTADHLVTSRDEHGVDLVGPVGADQSWQARQQTGYAVAQFAIDWEARQATCPRGKRSVVWKPGLDSNRHPVVNIRWAHADCGPCPVRRRCISHDRPRALQVRVQPQFAALMAARQRQITDDFKERYATRAGVEGTIAQGVRRCDLRRTRFIGLAKTGLGHVFIATALNLVRVAAWLAEAPRSTTRRSAFAALAPSVP